METEAKIKQLQTLLYDDEDFAFISQYTKNKRKHIFSVIGKQHDELTFSRMLKYFLDPNEDHLLQDYFLRKFLHYLIKNNEEYFVNLKIDRLTIDTYDLNDTKIYREFYIEDQSRQGRLDIYIIVDNRIHILIENKLYSSEGAQQTFSYKRWADKFIKNKKVIFCFITPEGYNAEEDDFLPLSFNDLLNIFNIQHLKKEFDDRVSFLLNNFITWVKEYIPMDSEIKKKCRAIYRNYKDAIDLLLKHIPSVETFIIEIANFINNDKTNDYTAQKGSYWITVSPKSWIENEHFKANSKYSKLRYQYNFDQLTETSTMYLIMPDNEYLKEKVSLNANLLFNKNIDEVTHNNWSNQDHYEIKKEQLITENLIDNFETEAEKYAKEIVEKFNNARRECFDIDFENEWLKSLIK